MRDATRGSASPRSKSPTREEVRAEARGFGVGRGFLEKQKLQLRLEGWVGSEGGGVIPY